MATLKILCLSNKLLLLSLLLLCKNVFNVFNVTGSGEFAQQTEAAAADISLRMVVTTPGHKIRIEQTPFIWICHPLPPSYLVQKQVCECYHDCHDLELIVWTLHSVADSQPAAAASPANMLQMLLVSPVSPPATATGLSLNIWTTVSSLICQ